jgi:PAS domain S-box-containing protein
MVHALLARQLKKVGASVELPPAGADNWQQLVERISQFYAGAEQERYLLERALNVSSAEMEALSGRLAEERDTLTAILRSLGDGVSALDEEGHVVLLNPEGERLLGWQESELLGKPLLPAVWPTDTSLHDLVGAGHAQRDEEGVLVRKDGTQLAVAYVLTPLMRDDRLAGAVLVFRDMTERNRAREAETQLIRLEAARSEALASARRLRALVQNASDLFVLLDAEWLLLYA